MKYDVKVNKQDFNGAIKAYASITINEEFMVTGVKILEGSKGVFVSMPNYKNSKGEYKDICFPTTKESRKEIEDAVIEAYNNCISLDKENEVKEEMPTSNQEMVNG